MAASGEPYNVAARKLNAARPAGAAGEVVACVNATLAVPNARFEYRRVTDVAALERREPHRPGPVGRLARFAATAVWNRISPEVDAPQLGEMLRESFLHLVGEGVVEPAAGRYQVDYGGYALMYFDGQLYSGPSGAPLRAKNRRRRARPQEDDPLGPLRLLRDVTEARYCGEEALRGTPCRVIAVRAGSDRFTVWIDHEHVRRIQSEYHGRGYGQLHSGSAKVTKTFELWDFGVLVDSLDWAHLPSFRAPG
jgi:hypothetical protein